MPKAYENLNYMTGRLGDNYVGKRISGGERDMVSFSDAGHYAHRFNRLTDEGFRDWEARWLAMNRITLPNIKAYRKLRKGVYNDFMNQKADEGVNESEAEAEWDARLQKQYIDNGWLFKTSEGFNPFDALDEYAYKPQHKAGDYPDKRRRILRDYSEMVTRTREKEQRQPRQAQPKPQYQVRAESRKRKYGHDYDWFLKHG